MESFTSPIFFVFSFFALYVQVFLLLVFLDNKKEIVLTDIHSTGVDFPPVTIIVPCWNEGETVAGTLDSLLTLDYPQNKLTIKVIDDGSTDNTWEVLKRYKDIPQIELIQKKNEGGKHHAVNFALETTTTDIVGCLDADSFVEKDTLKKLMVHFNDPEVMAVSPSILVYKPENFIQKAQNVQYDMAVFLKKIIGTINGIHVTPGPFSFYRTKVFHTIGFYKKAHNTEDMEIAYRMQINKMKIAQCHDAFVYTVVPKTIKTLYKQQLRWIYGFINNTIDYRKYLFKKEYGAFSTFTVPWGIMGFTSVVVFFFISLISMLANVWHSIQKLLATDFFLPSFSVNNFNVDLFFIDSRPLTFITLLLTLSVFGMVLIGMRMRQKRPIPNISFIYFIIIYSIVGPFWMLKAVYNTLFSKETAWR